MEAILLKHPKVRDVGVVGLPDELAGELPLAFVVRNDGQDVTETELQKYVSSKYQNNPGGSLNRLTKEMKVLTNLLD